MKAQSVEMKDLSQERLELHLGLVVLDLIQLQQRKSTKRKLVQYLSEFVQDRFHH